MPRKGMRSLGFSPKTPPPSPSRFGFSPSHPSFSDLVMDRTLEIAEPLITKWNPETSSITSLFYESRREAKDFIKTVNGLQKAIHFQATSTYTSHKLARAKSLLQIAMNRLQKEFYQILSMNRAHLHPDSVSDLRLISDCMISSGYGKECSNIYKIIRKSIVDECIYRLGVEKLSSNQIRRMSWEALETRIGNWLNAVRTATKKLFNGERILCDHVFASSDSLRESCFAEISKAGAMILFAFPEQVSKHTRKSPEKIFRALDMYNAISDLRPDIDSIFSSSDQLTESIKSQVLTSLSRLSEFVRAALSGFEATLMKDSSKSTIAGAGIHDLTVDTMSYVSSLADYCNILPEILADSKRKMPPDKYFGFSDSGECPAPAISRKMVWLVLVLLCKLDTKAKYYKDISLSFLFLANNLQYVVVKVRTSNLKYLFGDEWLGKYESKVKRFVSKYERLGWGHVIDSIPSDPAAVNSPAKVKEIFKAFNASFDQACRKQAVCVVPDSKLRDEIKVSVARKIIRPYREFYDGHRQKLEGVRFAVSAVRYAPGDVRRHLSDLFVWSIC